MRTLPLLLAAASAAAGLATAPASASHGCVQPRPQTREICVIPHSCVYYPEGGYIVCEWHR